MIKMIKRIFAKIKEFIMSLTYGGQQPKSIKYNNVEVKSIIYGGKTVWTKIKATHTFTGSNRMEIFNIPDGCSKIISINGKKTDINVRPGASLVFIYDRLSYDSGPWFDVTLPCKVEFA